MASAIPPTRQRGGCLIQGTEVIVVYVFPVFGGEHQRYAERFFNTYRDCDAGAKHRLIVVSNGGAPTPAMERAMEGVAHETVIHDDSGWEIGAYRKVARETDCDLMVCFGGSTRLTKKGWLKRMVAAYQESGESLCGATANNGDLPVHVWPHIRTTAFWFPPVLLNSYPHPVTSDRPSRHAFEHGPNNFTVWATNNGLKALEVAWQHKAEWPHWGGYPNAYHRGDQSQVIALDRMCEPPFYNK